MSTEFQCGINVVRMEGKTFSNATITNLDGDVKATWTVDEDGSERTSSSEVDKSDFEALWDALNEPVFIENKVRDPDARLDFKTCYVVSIFFNIEGQSGQGVYLIPQDEDHPEWTSWLRTFKMTRGGQ